MGGRSSRSALALLLATVCARSIGLSAQPGPDARALSDRTASRIGALQREADGLAVEALTLLGEVRRLELDRAIQREAAAQAEATWADVAAARDRAATRVAALAADRVARSPVVARQLVEIYKRGRGGYARLLLSSDERDALGRMNRGAFALAALERLRLEAHRRALASERTALADLTRRQDAVAAAQAEAATARAALDAALAARNRMLGELGRRRDLAVQFVAELQAAQVALQRTMPAAAVASPPRLPLRPFRGALDWPIAGRVITNFGRTPAGPFGTTILRNGIEIAADEGAAVRAVHEGTVAFAAPFAALARS